ncbi:hypothetical protein GCM10007108_01000 [Thermogymnomonas acidicola]|uniref:Uncharacterized protein n=1 Tax=Thermogymnomonas acidicola TaxID=399579 RepID=A0AA37BPT2_9ARCH|nr:hypothetical protein [Thermogymnomonas acidicola]GGM66628.1 hypothetical protein GCM10007108_01000 [Thermogymnomonas acidicola]
MEVWNGGSGPTDGFSSSAFAGNVRLMLRRILRTSAEPGGPSSSLVDRLLTIIVSSVRAFRKACGWVSWNFMNSSMAYYIAYAAVSFLLVIVVASLF